MEIEYLTSCTHLNIDADEERIQCYLPSKLMGTKKTKTNQRANQKLKAAEVSRSFNVFTQDILDGFWLLLESLVIYWNRTLLSLCYFNSSRLVLKSCTKNHIICVPSQSASILEFMHTFIYHARCIMMYSKTEQNLFYFLSILWGSST